LSWARRSLSLVTFSTTLSEAGIGFRTAPRNEFLGTIVTCPTFGTRLFGIAYHDHDRRDTGPDEDLYLLDVQARTLTHYPGKQYERTDPRFAGCHRGDKSYLRQPTAYYAATLA
jgi:hypothetical protein